MSKLAAHFVLMLLLVMAGTTACVSTQKLPLINGKETVAMVNGEPLTRAEYQQEISALHTKMLEEQNNEGKGADGDKTVTKQAGRIDYSGLLKRMINARLIVQEAKRIGLNDLPEVKEEVGNYSQKALRTLLMKQAVKDVKPDEQVVDELYRKAIHDWKFGSVMFPKEDDARQMEAEIKKGANFNDLVAKAVADKKASGGKDEGYLNGNDVLAPIGDALLTMVTGSVSPVIAVPGGYTLVKLEDTRLQESPEKKEWATQEALRLRKAAASQEFIEKLKKKLVTTNTELLDSIDLGASVEKFDKYLKDERVIAKIGDDETITVSALAAAVQRKFFHGIESEIGKRKKDLKTKKYEVMDQMVEKKVLMKEALNEGIDKTDAYAVFVNTYENSLVFGMFIQKVVLPDIKVMESEVKAYYESHRSDYTSPEKMKLDSVVFKNRVDAEEAMRKLRAGDQLSWIKANAGGQVGKDAEGVLQLDGKILATSELDEGLKVALSGAEAGNFRLYVSPGGYFYVISIESVYPPETEDYLSVREPIAKQLFNEHVQAGLNDWIEKLRNNAHIDVYLKN